MSSNDPDVPNDQPKENQRAVSEPFQRQSATSPPASMPKDAQSDRTTAANAVPPAVAAAVEAAGLDEPTWLHPTSIMFDIISNIRRNLIPAIIAIFSASQGTIIGLGIAGIIFGSTLLFSLLRYFTLRYQITHGDLVVSEGILFRRVRTVPVRRIQNIDLVQNPLHRLFNVAEVRVETASGSEPEATLRVLSVEQLHELRNAVFAQPAAGPSTQMAGRQEIGSDQQDLGGSRTADGPHEAAQEHSLPSNEWELEKPLAAAGPQTEDVPLGQNHQEIVGKKTNGTAHASKTPTIAYQEHGRRAKQAVEWRQGSAGENLLMIPLSWLVKAGLASNRGLLIVGVALGLASQLNVFEQIDYEQLEKWVPQNANNLSTLLWGLTAFVVFMIALRLFGVGWYILRFFNYRLDLHDEDLRISCGLFTQVMATVPRRRIQFISIHQPMLMRWMGLASLRIETAGGGSKQEEDASTTVSRRWFVPVLPFDQVNSILRSLRPGLHWDDAEFTWHPLATGAALRRSRLAIIQSLAIMGIGMLITRPWGWIPGAALCPLLIVLAVKRSRSMKYARTRFGVAYRSGVLIRKMSVTFFERIQTIRLDETPFDRRWNMAQLSVDTAAAGPANHLIDIPYLDAGFAKREFEFLRRQVAKHEPVWN